MPDLRIEDRVRAYAERVDLVQRPVALADVRARSRGSAPRRRSFAVAVAFVVALAVLVGVIAVQRRDGEVAPANSGVWKVDEQRAYARLADIPEGVSTATFGTTPVFVVRHGDDVHVFLTDVQHIEANGSCCGARTSECSGHPRTARPSTGMATRSVAPRNAASRRSRR